MTVDIETVERIELADYVVRVGAGDDGYYATVIAHGEELSRPHPMMRVVGCGRQDVRGPVVSTPHKHSAVGLAVDAYEWAQSNEEVRDELYSHSTVEGVSVEELIKDIEL